MKSDRLEVLPSTDAVNSLSSRLGSVAKRFFDKVQKNLRDKKKSPFVRHRQSRRRTSHLVCQDSPPAVPPFVRTAERDDGCLRL